MTTYKMHRTVNKGVYGVSSSELGQLGVSVFNNGSEWVVTNEDDEVVETGITKNQAFNNWVQWRD